MARIEAAIQAAVIKWVHETYPHIKITATQNEKSYMETQQIGDVGITDLLLFKKQDCLHVLFLELKRKNGRLHKSQHEWNASFDICFLCDNSMRAVAYGFSQAKAIISKWA